MFMAAEDTGLFSLTVEMTSCQQGRISKSALSVKVKGKVVPVLNLIKHYAIKAYGGVDV
jgi:hypothetical protein